HTRRPAYVACLLHVADEEERDARLLADAQQPRGRLAHLGDGPRRGTDLRRVERLDRVDYAHIRPLAPETRADRIEVRLGEDLDLLGAAEARGAQLHLGGRLLTGHEQRAP